MLRLGFLQGPDFACRLHEAHMEGNLQNSSTLCICNANHTN